MNPGRRQFLLLAAAFLACGRTALAADLADEALAPVTDDPKLPRVLLIGDSISLGYTRAVREMLRGTANVHRIPDNGGPTTRGVALLDEWLGTGKWDAGVTKKPGSVGLAMFGRDRLAFLSTRDPIEAGGKFTSKPLANPGNATLSLNADGLSEGATLRVELLDKNGTPVAGYTGSAGAVVKTSGLKTKAWPGGDTIKCPNAALRVRVHFAGTDATKIRFYAAYLE